MVCDGLALYALAWPSTRSIMGDLKGLIAPRIGWLLRQRAIAAGRSLFLRTHALPAHFHRYRSHGYRNQHAIAKRGMNLEGHRVVQPMLLYMSFKSTEAIAAVTVYSPDFKNGNSKVNSASMLCPANM